VGPKQRESFVKVCEEARYVREGIVLRTLPLSVSFVVFRKIRGVNIAVAGAGSKAVETGSLLPSSGRSCPIDLLKTY
jgi:hypothetical protein